MFFLRSAAYDFLFTGQRGGISFGHPVTPKTVSIAVVLSVCGSCTVSDLSDLFSQSAEVSVCRAESRHTKGVQ